MGSIFKAWETDAQWLLPPSLQDLLPEGHRVHYIRDLVADELDLSATAGAHAGVRGQPPFDPKMMAALLFHAYSEGIHSSRRIAKACAERVDFMVPAMRQTPCHRTISGFRKRHLEALSGLFGQIVAHCVKAGLADLKHVALDGTKVQANASKHKATGHGRMEKAERELAAEIAAGMLKAAEEADAAEDADPPEERADPAWIADRRKRHGSPAPARGGERPGSRAAAMAERLRREGRSGPCRLRKCTVEPVFGQIKEARGFRRFLLRGLDSVRCEWGILCAAHNIGKLAALRAAESAAAA